MRVLVADTFERSGLDGLAAAGCEVLFEPDLKDDALVERVHESRAEALVVRGTKVPAAAIEIGAAPRGTPLETIAGCLLRSARGEST